MAIDPLVLELLDEVESGKTPEEACAAHPNLVGEVRARLGRLERVRDQLDALFPNGGTSRIGWSSTTPPTSTPEIPGHAIESVIGRGGMGVVYKARHLRLNRLVAVKMMLNGGYAGPPELARFLREAEALAAVGHPNIVRIYEVGDIDGLPYFAMEFVEGETLAQRLGGVPMPADQAASLLAVLAAAMQAAHAVGIVHRDLKPANILIADDGSPKVTDFGLAWRHDAGAGLTRTGLRVGTPSYMAPEQASGGAASFGPATDIYALGAILYEMLTGRPPFRAETAIETERQVITDDPVPPTRLNSRVPKDLETICLKCLSKEPQKRYATTTALREDLGRFLRGDSISARPQGTLARLARRVRRRPFASGALASGVLLTLVLIGVAVWLTSERLATTRAAAADLEEMAGWLEKSLWPEANAALQRARGRVGDGGPADVRRRLDQGDRELELAARLDGLRTDRVKKVGISLPFVRVDEQADETYEGYFRQAGIGSTGDDPEQVAARVRISNIRNALVAALDDWAVCVRDPTRRDWVLEVTRRADPDRTGWRDRVRDPASRKSRAVLIDLTNSAPVGDQAVSLLLALSQYLEEVEGDPVPLLMRVQQSHPSDLWVNYTLANKLRERRKFEESARYYQAALAIRPRTPALCNNLGLALMESGRFEEAGRYFDLALEIDPAYNPSFGNLGILWFHQKRYEESFERLRQAIGRRPEAGAFHYVFGRGLERKGKDEEALVHYQRAVELEPKHMLAQRDLRRMLIRLGRIEEGRASWSRLLATGPSQHDAWFGFAELCLFLGKEDDYRLARRELLVRFGESADPHVAERTARACLLGPISGDELRQAVALADRAAGAERSRFEGSYPYFLFARGLAQYRQGQFGLAIATMQGDAAGVLSPAPSLVLAMALQRSGRTAEARQTLKAAVEGHDWSAGRILDHENWIVHVLRREAEGLILGYPTSRPSTGRTPTDND